MAVYVHYTFHIPALFPGSISGTIPYEIVNFIVFDACYLFSNVTKQLYKSLPRF